MAEEWSNWFLHDGKGCPLGIGVFVNVELWCGCKPSHRIDQQDFNSDDWKISISPSDCKICGLYIQKGSQPILRYRIRKPRGLTILQDLIEQLPETVEV